MEKRQVPMSVERNTSKQNSSSFRHCSPTAAGVCTNVRQQAMLETRLCSQSSFRFRPLRPFGRGASLYPTEKI